LTEDGNVNLERVQLILTELGAVEDEIFKRRQENELQFRARNKAKRRRERAQTAPAWIPANSFGPTPVGGGSGYGSGIDGNTTRHMARDMRVQVGLL
jgi:5'-3' exoribonuclease 2